MSVQTCRYDSLPLNSSIHLLPRHVSGKTLGPPYSVYPSLAHLVLLLLVGYLGILFISPLGRAMITTMIIQVE